MYSIGEHIVYGTEGVCRVDDVGVPDMSWIDSSRTYYTLSPVYRRGVIYAPTDVTVNMRAVMSKDEALALIGRIPDIDSAPHHVEDCRKLADEYRTYIGSGDCMDLLQLIRMLYVKGVKAAAQGKVSRQTDDKFMKKAKELLYGELALSLDIPYDEVESTIVSLVSGMDARG